MVHVPHWGCTNIGRNRTKFILRRDVTPGIFAPMNINKKIRRFLILKQSATILSRRKRLVYSYTTYITVDAVWQSEQLSAYFTTIIVVK